MPSGCSADTALCKNVHAYDLQLTQLNEELKALLHVAHDKLHDEGCIAELDSS